MSDSALRLVWQLEAPGQLEASAQAPSKVFIAYLFK